jgi:hypothetical protein
VAFSVSPQPSRLLTTSLRRRPEEIEKARAAFGRVQCGDTRLAAFIPSAAQIAVKIFLA